MEILFLYRAISKHCISDAANDRKSLGEHSGKIKMYIIRDLQFQHKCIEMYLFPLFFYAKNIQFKCSLFGHKLYKSVIEIHYKNAFLLKRDVGGKVRNFTIFVNHESRSVSSLLDIPVVLVYLLSELTFFCLHVTEKPFCRYGYFFSLYITIWLGGKGKYGTLNNSSNASLWAHL